MNLVEAIREVRRKISTAESQKRKDIHEITQQYEMEVSALNFCIELLEDMNTACHECAGRGEISHLDGAGSTERDTCPVCKGTGKKQKKQN